MGIDSNGQISRSASGLVISMLTSILLEPSETDNSSFVKPISTEIGKREEERKREDWGEIIMI